MKKSKKKKKLLPKFNKDIKKFCFSEEGKISKSVVAKIGLTMAVLASVIDKSVACVHSSLTTPHDSNAYFANGHISGPTTTHASHPSHTSHGSHGSHGQW